MKLTKLIAGILLAIAIAIPVCSITGCQTGKPNPQAVAWRTLKSTQIAVGKAMTIYGDRCALGKVSVATQEKIDEQHRQYRIAFRAAVIAASADYSSITPDNVQALADALLVAITQL